MERRITLVTGANGFVGRSVCPELERLGWDVRRAVRSNHSNDPCSSDGVAVGDISASTDWLRALEGVDSIVHLAARAHRVGDHDAEAYHRINTEATIRLAEAALSAGVQRFVYLSSLKVLGDVSPQGRALTERDLPEPADEYAMSKWQAECALRQLGSRMEVVIVRPPLVYGPHVRANFLRLLEWIDRGAWLPFGAVRNRRSLIFSGNLASAIVACLRHPAAAGMTFLVSDGEDVSTPDLIRRIAKSLSRPDRSWSVPTSALRGVAAVSGFGDQVRRLLDSLVVDTQLIRTHLSWHPPFTVDEGLRATAGWFRDLRASKHELVARA